MKQLLTTSIISLLSLSLVACFVSPDDTPAHQRTSDNLRVYQPGNYLEYDISGNSFSSTGSSAALTGTLLVAYSSHAYIPEPLQSSGSVLPVMLETTNWSIDLGGSTYNETMRRFIHQDGVTGDMYLYAYGEATPDTYYWVTENPVTTSLQSPVTPVLITASPYVLAEQHGYAIHVWPDCDVLSACGDEMASLLEHQIITGTEEVTTNYGKFDAFRVTVDNGVLDYIGGNDTNMPINIDFRHFCNSIGTTTTTKGDATFLGTMWIYPEVGIVKYQIVCAADGNTIHLNASLANTNINLVN